MSSYNRVKFLKEKQVKTCLAQKQCRSLSDQDYRGPYSPTILKNILCLFLNDFQFGI